MGINVFLPAKKGPLYAFDIYRSKQHITIVHIGRWKSRRVVRPGSERTPDMDDLLSKPGGTRSCSYSARSAGLGIPAFLSEYRPSVLGFERMVDPDETKNVIAITD
jgi:hypothetical protein